jgi:hypothetical protein
VQDDEQRDGRAEDHADDEFARGGRTGPEQARECATGPDEPGDACEATQEPVAFLVDALHATPNRMFGHRDTRVPSLEL